MLPRPACDSGRYAGASGIDISGDRTILGVALARREVGGGVLARPTAEEIRARAADETVRLWDVATGTCLQILRADGSYQGMNIAGVTGISEAQKAALKTLGAVDEAPQ